MTCNDGVVVMMYRLVCALAAGSVVSACSTSVSGTPVLSTKTAVITEKAGIVAAAIPRYADVTGQGIEAPRDIEGDQFSATSVPGVKIGHRDAQGVAQKCTLGPAVTNGTRTGFLIAGHCDGDQYAQVNFDGRNPLSLGPAVQAQDEPTPQGYSDSAVIWTGTVDPSVTKIAGTWPITGVMSVLDVRALPAGTPICINGAVSGVRCSPLTAADDKIRYADIGDGGDSGAAVFVVDQKGGARLVGLLRGSDGDNPNIGVATFLEPALQRLGATALTAR
ncbi:S1 family peptidase [Mycobacteroides abscessus]|uniref:S1 family peptidase n=1 Tax=Mycobacteroides abscessus TaxID=36809 RepID=UPI002105DE2B|nr:S1 family peptidase [Mycobacteroides abscessus]